jgi:sialate O-acetylesterase
MKFFFSNFALFSTALLLLIHFSVKAQIKLPVVIGDNMVLQRGQNVPVWGKASPGSRLKVTFAGQSKYTRAAEDSSWRVDLDPLAASFQPAAMVKFQISLLAKFGFVRASLTWPI